MYKFLLLLIFFAISTGAFAKQQSAFVLTVKGKATKLIPGSNKATLLKKGDLLPKDSSVLTYDKSFALIRLANGDRVSLGGNSKMIIESSGITKSSYIALLKGQLRSQVPASIKSKIKSKRFKAIIKTRHAAVGVRGTDFLIIYNPKNRIMTNLTFSGEVSVVKIKDRLLLPGVDSKILGVLDAQDYAAILNSSDAKNVKEGRMSGVYKSHDKASIPTKISPVQYLILKRNTTLDSTKNIKRIVSGYTNKKVYLDYLDDPPPEGYFDSETKEYAPVAGGYIDIDTGLYIQTVVNSSLDKKNRVYRLNHEFGAIDKKTGNYIPPLGLNVDAKRGFLVKNLTESQKLEYGARVFDINTENLKGDRIKEQVKRTLKQLLISKKAILNHNVRKEELKSKYFDLEDEQYEDNLKEAMFDIKEIVDFYVHIITGHSSAPVDHFYSLPILFIENASPFFQLTSYIQNNNYLTSKWVVTPYLSINLKKYTESFEDNADPSKLTVNGGIKNIYVHTIASKKLNLKADLSLSKTNKLIDNHANYIFPYFKENESSGNESSFFQRDLSLKLSEKLFFTDHQAISINSSISKYDGFSSLLNGTKTGVGVSYHGQFKPRYDLKIELENNFYEANDSDVNFKDQKAQLSLDLVKLYFETNFQFQISNIKNIFSNPSFTQLEEIEENAFSLGISRDIRHNLTMEINYKTSKYSETNDLIKHTDEQINIGIKYDF